MSVNAPASAPEIVAQLRLLCRERELARLEGLATNRRYMADLEQDIAALRAAYVGAALTEIATFRAQLSGPLLG